MSQPAGEYPLAIESQVPFWEKTRDLVDQLIDISINYRQSGHPGGSRSKVPILLTALLSGAMRWDIRNPLKRFTDRFVLGAGHTVPLVYCTLAVLNEALRIKYRQTGDMRYKIEKEEQRALYWEHLLTFRRRGGLSGHAEMQGRTLFLKFNTGPSGHGSPAAAGIALALKRSGAGGVRVFILEGEGGLTPGATHETANSAWGLALDNLYFLVDWNDYGIDDHKVSSSVYGTPIDWFASHGFRVTGTDKGEDFGALTEVFAKAVKENTPESNPDRQPSALWFKTRKGRGYLKYDNASHGSPHGMNSDTFWKTKEEFQKKYGVRFANFGSPAPSDPMELAAEFKANLNMVIRVLYDDQALVDYLADRLTELGDSVPNDLSSFRLGKMGSPFSDKRLYDYTSYPKELFAAPGEKRANREAFGLWGSWINSWGMKHYGQPLFIASSADLAGSTNISGFAASFGGEQGCGWYERHGSSVGSLLPQEITEFANSGIMAGLASVNFSLDPEKTFKGFWGATSTYGSFSYLLYGMARLFSQMAQDCNIKLGRILLVAGHSGPETADDSRTHFGIFAPWVTQLFPRGQVLNLHPWEFNEVPVLLGAAFKTEVPVIVLHLTRPAITIPDRRALGIPSHFETAKGAYTVSDYDNARPKGGTIIVQGTSAMAGVTTILPELQRLNVKVIYASSAELFALQPAPYRNEVLTEADKVDSTVVTTQARKLMYDFLFTKIGEEYAVSSDWDDRWRTGGTLEEVLEEAHLTPAYILEGIKKFAGDRAERLKRLKIGLS
ncbi:MAG: transketolase [Spirochaetales bacterium]|nr:MAG: transketolase [Spirochaetales bacterium]